MPDGSVDTDIGDIGNYSHTAQNRQCHGHNNRHDHCYGNHPFEIRTPAANHEHREDKQVVVANNERLDVQQRQQGQEKDAFTPLVPKTEQFDNRKTDRNYVIHNVVLAQKWAQD